MAQLHARPELMFLTGPQQGHREVIMLPQAVAGRDPSADIPLLEQTVSRRQMSFELTNDGWVVVNLSANGTLINSKRYKGSRTRILIETGDVLTVGQQTKILFVSAGDDPNLALRNWQESNPPELQPDATTEEEPSQTAKPFAEVDDAELSIEETEALEKKAKIKKYAIIFGIYLLIMVAVIVALTTLKSPAVQEGIVQPPQLTSNQIRQAIDTDYKVNISDSEAGEMLHRAEQYYDRQNEEFGNRFRCVKAFKLYLAYSGSTNFPKNDHLGMYNECLDKLVANVTAIYNRAFIKAKAGRYTDAVTDFRTIKKMLPVKQAPMPDARHPVFDNVVKHISYISYLEQQRSQ